MWREGNEIGDSPLYRGVVQEEMKPADQNCTNCLFWQQIHDRTYGYCQRFPPQRIVGQEIRDGQSGYFRCGHIVVDGYQWCGEWKSN